MSFDRYLRAMQGDFRPAIKVEWLNPDESVNFEFTNALSDDIPWKKQVIR